MQQKHRDGRIQIWQTTGTGKQQRNKTISSWFASSQGRCSQRQPRTNGVNLINEDDGGGLAACLGKQVPVASMGQQSVGLLAAALLNTKCFFCVLSTKQAQPSRAMRLVHVTH